MNLITCFDWTDADDDVEYAPTNDPRIVAIIKRDDYATFNETLDGDAINPTYIIERGRVEHTGGYADDEHLAQRIVDAHERFTYAAGYRNNGLSYAMIERANTLLARWAWVFHGTTFNRGHYGYSNAYEILIMSTPDFRAHVGMPDDCDQATAQADADALTSEVAAVADGEVWAIGYATNPGRVLGDEPIDLADGDWDVQPEVWGFVGTDYARQSAAAFEAGTPNLPPMLDIAA